jgi:hypothetical protein
MLSSQIFSNNIESNPTKSANKAELAPAPTNENLTEFHLLGFSYTKNSPSEVRAILQLRYKLQNVLSLTSLGLSYDITTMNV